MKANTSFWAWFDTIKPFLGRRVDCYEQMFRYLDDLNRSVCIVETGCMRRDPMKPESWIGDGCSTMMFDKYVQDRGGDVYSVDISEEYVNVCRELVSERTHVHLGDSVHHLADLVATGIKPDLVYLDSLDRMVVEPFGTALHCAKEFDAIRPAFSDETLLVIDDTPATFIKGKTPTIETTGKGAFVRVYAKHVGAETMFCGWQVGWTHLVGVRRESKYEPLLYGYKDRCVDLDGDITRLVERARKHIEKDQAADAEDIYRAVLVATKTPQSGLQRVAHGEACAFYARIASAVGMYGTACDWYRDAIVADPRFVDYRLEIVRKGHIPMMNFHLAKQEMKRCILLETENPDCWRLMGDVEVSLCNAKGALEAYTKQCELLPDDPHAMLDLCVVALDLADYDTCRALADKIMQTDRRPDGLHVLAMIANREGRHEDAIKLFDEALDADCNNIVITHWNKSLSLLALGRYKDGWAEHEWRKDEPRNPALSLPFQRFTRPLYEGQDPEVLEEDGKTRKAILLVHAEAGMGDNIVFSRFLREFVAKGFAVRYESHVEMRDLIARSFPDVEVVSRAPDYPGAIGLHNFDYHLPLGSLPHVLGTDYDTVPAYESYLKPDPVLVSAYRDKLGGRRAVGICWSSGIRDYGIWIQEYGKRKSMHFDMVAPLVAAIEGSGMLAVNLQVGPERAQHQGRVFEALPEKPTWDDTAALMANLDIIITVDTGVVHLAGALGRPTWLMMQQDGASFHFMTERPGAPWNEASPWYPSVRIFRQSKPGDWGGVIARVARELAVVAS
jgi:tetratricopeptide (TPR) repeat protein